MTRDEFIQSLKTEQPEKFLEQNLLRRSPIVFQGNEEEYFSWRTKLSSLIDVDPSCIMLVGSSAVGFSLNPYKNYKKFSDESDIDVAVVSSQYFVVAWRYLRMNLKPSLNLDYKTRSAWIEHQKSYVYWGTIAADKLLGVLPFGKEWLAATTALASVNPTCNRDIKLRIYYDHDSFRSYQLRGIKNLRDSLLGAE
jgi:hypothetical protein